MKTCKKCGEAKPKAEFGKHAKMRDGLNCRCRACQRIASAKYRVENPDKIKAALIKWREENAAHVLDYRAKYNDKNSDRRKQLRRERYAEITEREKANTLAWQAKNKERVAATAAKYRAENPEKVKARRVLWGARNPGADRIYKQNRRERKRANGGKLSNGLAEKLFILQKGKCPCCKQPLGDNYHLDHIMPLALGGANEDWNMQLLRQQCNNQKHAKHPIDFMKQRGFLL